MLLADQATLQSGVRRDRFGSLAQDLLMHRDDVPIDILY